MNGRFRFVVCMATGHVFSEKAVKTVPSAVEDMIGARLAETELLTLNPVGEELEAARLRVAQKVAAAKAKKEVCVCVFVCVSSRLGACNNKSSLYSSCISVLAPFLTSHARRRRRPAKSPRRRRGRELGRSERPRPDRMVWRSSGTRRRPRRALRPPNPRTRPTKCGIRCSRTRARRRTRMTFSRGQRQPAVSVLEANTWHSPQDVMMSTTLCVDGWLTGRSYVYAYILQILSPRSATLQQ